MLGCFAFQNKYIQMHRRGKTIKENICVTDDCHMKHDITREMLPYAIQTVLCDTELTTQAARTMGIALVEGKHFPEVVV